MDRNAIKQRIRNGDATPDVPQALFIELLTECVAERTGQTPRLVDLHEAISDRPLPGTDHHARMRGLLEGSASETPRSNLKTEPDVTESGYLPRGVDIGAALRRHAERYKATGVTINRPIGTAKPLTLAESHEDLAKRIPDPIERAYVLLSGRAKPWRARSRDQRADHDPRMCQVSSSGPHRVVAGHQSRMSSWSGSSSLKPSARPRP